MGVLTLSVIQLSALLLSGIMLSDDLLNVATPQVYERLMTASLKSLNH
jgi:hypothetical protein